MRQSKNIFILTIIMTMAVSSCNQEKSKNNSGGDATSLLPPDTAELTNDFYDNAQTYELPMADIMVEGEVENPGKAALIGLPLRSVIVKEAEISGDTDKFVGAYRYDGYSLYDILNYYIPKKNNSGEFSSVIDLYVEISNAKGEKVYFSWGEIYYPVHRYEIIIAKQVARIVPSKTKELWPVPQDYKLVVGPDLVTERNISNPVKITVKSYPKSLKTVKGMSPCYSPEMTVYNENEKIASFSDYPSGAQIEEYQTVFYGRGRGIHSTRPFHGMLLKELLAKNFPMSKQYLQQGLFLISGIDGYRAVFSYAEIMDRNDQSEVMLIADPQDKQDGVFRTFVPADFFSDRAIKGINSIYFSTREK